MVFILAMYQNPKILIFWVVLLSTQVTGQSLQFDKEKITIKIVDSECILTGDYYFKNPSHKICEQRVFYPVIKNKDLPFPHLFKVIDVIADKSIHFTMVEKGICFGINIPPFSTRAYRVEYHQKTPMYKMEYILTTTSFWGKLLRIADFLIHIPPKYCLKFLSFPYDSLEEADKGFVYHIHREHFMPDKNLILEWRACDEK